MRRNKKMSPFKGFHTNLRCSIVKIVAKSLGIPIQIFKSCLGYPEYLPISTAEEMADLNL